MTIRETYPHSTAALMTASDDFLHFVDMMGDSWCTYTDYKPLSLYDEVVDDSLDQLCVGCATEAMENEEEH